MKGSGTLHTLARVAPEVISSVLAATPAWRKAVAMPVSILVVDDNQAIRKALRLFFSSYSDFQVCGEAADGLEAIRDTQRLKPDAVVLDFAMPKLNGLEAAKAIESIFPGLPIIMFTCHMSQALEKQARAAGIRAVLSKTDGLESLLTEIQRVATHRGNENDNGETRKARSGI